MKIKDGERDRRLRNNKKTPTLIRQLREQRGWTQADIAEFTGYSRVYINSVELGRVPNPSITLIRKLARLFNVPMERLCL